MPNPKEKSEITFLEEINEKLDILIKLLSANISLNKKDTEIILKLSKIGMKPKDIAEVLGTTSNTVSVTLNKKGG